MSVLKKFEGFMGGLAQHEQQKLHGFLTHMYTIANHAAKSLMGNTPGSINGINSGKPMQMPPGRTNPPVSPYVNSPGMQHLQGPGSTDPYYLNKP